MWQQTKRSIRSMLIVLIVVFAIVAIVQIPAFWKMVFPIAYKDTIFDAAGEFGVDPYLVTAVIRVESKFYPRAISKKGARGLMQLMPDTAKWAASELGVKNYNQDMLFEPDFNVRLGTWYLAQLEKQFNDDLVVVLAAYNGGSGNVTEWLNKQIWTGEEHEIEDIPFKETREYVWKVLKNYRVYRDIYK